MISSSLIRRRMGIATVGAASYAAVVYFTYQFMTVNVEKQKLQAEAAAITASSNSQSVENNTSSSSSTVGGPGCCGCQCYSSITDPKRTLTFQKIADVYDEQLSRDEIVMGLPLLRRALLYFNATGKVLEVGAGTGRNLDYYPSGDVDSVVLTDASENMLLQARKKVKELSPVSYKDKFKLFVADAEHITRYYANDSFDTVVDTFGLCSFDDPVAVLKELQRVCRQDGKILLLEHGRSKSWQGLTNYLDKYAERHATNWGCVWNRDLDKIIEEAGLEIETLTRWHFGTTYYYVCRPSAEVKRQKVDLDVKKAYRESDVEESNNVYSDKPNSFWKRFFRR